MIRCPRGHADLRLSVPKSNGRAYWECRTCDRNVKRMTRRTTRHLLRIADLMAETRGT